MLNEVHMSRPDLVKGLSISVPSGIKVGDKLIFVRPDNTRSTLSVDSVSNDLLKVVFSDTSLSFVPWSKNDDPLPQTGDYNRKWTQI